MRVFFLLILMMNVTGAALAQNTRSDRAMEYVERTCLSGSGFKLQLDAAGNLKLLRLSPGAGASVDALLGNVYGGLSYSDENLRQSVDREIRLCLERNIDKVLDMLKSQPAMIEGTSSLGSMLSELEEMIFRMPEIEGYDKAAKRTARSCLRKLKRGDVPEQRDFNRFCRDPDLPKDVASLAYDIYEEKLNAYNR